MALDRLDFAALQRAPCRGREEAMLALCAGKRVLDVGCVGQDSRPGMRTWLHGRLAGVAAAAVGVDTETSGIDAMRRSGYDACTPEAVTGRGECFDVVVMADVIEHVGDPVGFLRFYSPLLAPGGIMAITTPNAHRALNTITILLRNNYWLNREHTCWFCPLTLDETVRRAGLVTAALCWVTYQPTEGDRPNLATRMAIRAALCLARARRLLSPGFMLVAAVPEAGRRTAG